MSVRAQFSGIVMKSNIFYNLPGGVKVMRIQGPIMLGLTLLKGEWLDVKKKFGLTNKS